MDYRNADPGAVQFGNFINYYNFNSAEDRLKLLPTNVWLPEFPQEPATDRPYLVLDVGCNSGVFTQLLWKFLREHTGRRVHVLGIDIDPSLINRARESNQQMDNVSFDTVDVMNDSDFPRVMDFLHSHERSRFDAVCCFSITMWIHLNHHDIGLQNFLRKLTVIADLFVVEPQPWKCYQTAERRMKKAGEVFPLFLELKWRSNVEQEIQNFMENDLGRRKTFECCPTKWKRRICFYRDKNES